MPTYESILVFKPVLSDAEVSDFVKKAQETITQEGGQSELHELWGRRKLSHPIGKNFEALYAYLRFKGQPALLRRLERDWTLAENVLRHMTSRPVERKPRVEKARKPKPAAAPARQDAAPLAP